jgi:hypothetical protein
MPPLLLEANFARSLALPAPFGTTTTIYLSKLNHLLCLGSDEQLAVAGQMNALVRARDGRTWACTTDLPTFFMIFLTKLASSTIGAKKQQI